MKRRLLIGGGALALCSTLVFAQSAPESLLPPGFDNPTPAPAPAPAPTVAPAPTQSAAPVAPAAPVTNTTPGSTPVIQPLPGVPAAPAGPVELPAGLPTLEELEELNTDQLDEVLGLKPKFDIPAAARRSLSQVGILAPAEGGLPTNSLARQPASIVRAALSNTNGPLVSRWGHILLRRALSSRLAAPEGMSPVEFAALRANVLNNMGEHAAARALVQDVDTGNWDDALTDAGLEAYIGTADVVGACPAVRLQGSERAEDDPQWSLLQAICNAFAGEGTRAGADLTRALRNEDAPEIDILLAQRYAGAAGRGRRAVNLEWEGVDSITPWRFALANALGAELPDALTDDLGPYYQRIWALSPAVGLDARLAGSEIAAREGLLSSEAMVDLYSQAYEANGGLGDASVVASRLREAYVGVDPAMRLAAIRDVWGGTDGGSGDYSRRVLTAFAAARMPADAEYLDDAGNLISSMLAAGLDRDAMQWGPVVPQGSAGWAQLVLVQPQRNSPVASSAVDIFIGDDSSSESRRSQFLLAGLAGLGRIDGASQADFEQELAVDLTRQSKWAQLISQAADANNQPMVAFLAGLGMQGSSWDRMTARNLYMIVSSLNRVGLSAEARLIAAEAIARA